MLAVIQNLARLTDLQGWSGEPARFLPSTVPTRVSGRITNRQIQLTATCHIKKGSVTVGTYYGSNLELHPHRFDVLDPDLFDYPVSPDPNKLNSDSRQNAS